MNRLMQHWPESLTEAIGTGGYVPCVCLHQPTQGCACSRPKALRWGRTGSSARSEEERIDSVSVDQLLAGGPGENREAAIL